jgi:hypothetical protein
MATEPDALIPWQKYPELTKERLSLIGSVIRDTREDVATLHDPESGDGPWGFGCRAYERTCFAIEKATEKNSWLTILKDTERHLRFSFAIGHVPFRFYRGDPEDPPSRFLAVSYPELRETQLALDLGVVVPCDGVLRIAIETDATGRASTISVIEMDVSRTVTGLYAIPPDVDRAAVPLRAKPVDTPAPVIEPLTKSAETKKRERNVSNG